MYCVRLDLAARLLPRIGNANKSGEYYITDLISLAVAEGCKVQGVQCGRDESLMGVNSPLELSRSEEFLWSRVRRSRGRARSTAAAWCVGAPVSTPIA